MGVVKHCEVYWDNPDTSVGGKIQKPRPALIVSPNNMHAALPRVIIAPLTSGGQSLGYRPEVKFKGKSTTASQWRNTP